MPTIVDVTRFEGTGGANFSVTTPAGAQAGDVLVLVYRCQSNSANGYVSRAGWTHVTTQGAQPDTNHRVSGVLVRVLEASDIPLASTLTFTLPSNTSSQRLVANMILVRPTAGGTLSVAGTPATYGGTLSTRTVTAAAYTATTTGTAWTMVAAGGEFTAGSSHVPSAGPVGLTLVDTTIQPRSDATALATSRTSLSVYAGAAGAATYSTTFTGTPTAPAILAVTFDEVVVVPGDPRTEVEVVTASGVKVGHLEVMTENGPMPVKSLLALPWSGYTVDEMDDDIAHGRDVYWAHRGGSLNWSEMTMRAFTNSVWHGAKALEISVCRSADGVYIMSHDSTLNRVTGTNLGAISAVQSSAMLGLPISVPTTGGVVGRLEEVMDAYGDLLLIVDDKTGVNYPAFLALLNTLPDAAQHVIVKIDGATSYTRFQAAQGAGFKTAAYFYESTPSAKVTENMPYVDYPGLNWDASQSAWTSMLSYGKPVWGHVLPSAASKVTAKSKGATIFQCADVLGTIPQINEV